MTRTKQLGFGLLTVGTMAAVVACGSAEDGALNSGSGGSDAGSTGGTAGGGTSSGGSSTGGSSTGGSAGASGSSAGSGGSSSGGTSGSGGSGGADPCPPATTPGLSRLCLNFAPEAMQLEAGNVDLDGVGVLWVEVFDTAMPDPEGGPEVPAIRGIFLPMGGPPLSIRSLPSIEFNDLPSTVFVRAVFIDREELLNSQSIGWGAWIGGNDLSAGLEESPLDAVTLPPGGGRTSTLALTALRRLQVNLGVGTATPLDNAQGPATWAAFDTAEPPDPAPIFGLSDTRCVDISSSRARLDGFVVSSGTFHVVAGVDDFNLGEITADGSLINLVDLGGTFAIADSITFAADQYSGAMDIDLDTVIPLSGDAGVPPSYSCP